MSYCVNCGVELNPGAACCPLCQTPVVNPRQPVDTAAVPFFPTRRAEVAPVSKRELALLLTTMLASVALCCALLNLVLESQYNWYLFVAGGAAMLWVWFVFPLLVRRVSLWVRLLLDVGAVGLYVFLISLALQGRAWFAGLAVPILGVAAVTVLALGLLLRRGHSVLTTLTMLLAAAGLFCLGTEACCDLYLTGQWTPSWSLVVLVCCVGLCIPLVVVRRVSSLREEVRRRFHF